MTILKTGEFQAFLPMINNIYLLIYFKLIIQEKCDLKINKKLSDAFILDIKCI